MTRISRRFLSRKLYSVNVSTNILSRWNFHCRHFSFRHLSGIIWTLRYELAWNSGESKSWHSWQLKDSIGSVQFQRNWEVKKIPHKMHSHDHVLQCKESKLRNFLFGFISNVQLKITTFSNLNSRFEKAVFLEKRNFHLSHCSMKKSLTLFTEPTFLWSKKRSTSSWCWKTLVRH